MRRIKRDGRTEMTEPRNGACSTQPAIQHGPGIVGDTGERRKPHPVQEVESISTLPMVLPPTHQSGAGHGDAQARRQSRGVSECRRH